MTTLALRPLSAVARRVTLRAALPLDAALALTARRPAIARAAVSVIVALNAAWALGSLVLAAGAWATPSALGTARIVAQGLVVAAFATRSSPCSRPTIPTRRSSSTAIGASSRPTARSGG